MVRTGFAVFLLYCMIDSGEQAHKKQSGPTGKADQHIHLMIEEEEDLPRPTISLLSCCGIGNIVFIDKLFDHMTSSAQGRTGHAAQLFH